MNNPQVHTILLQGLGGTGKSTIASYLYQNTDFVVKFWADVSLKPDFTVFAEQIIIVLGGKVTFPIDINELINNLLFLLCQRRCLLVVDNLETLLDKKRNWRDESYQQFFSRWLQQGKNSTILLTTQDKPQLFQGLQYWYSLGGMKIEEGIALLKKLEIKGSKTEFKTFVEDVDGHPLTIELVAGYLREYCDSQLSQVKKLGLEQFELIYQEASGLHRDKQDARLSWIIQQHLARLSSEQKQFLFNLIVYRLPFNREAASYLIPIQKQNFFNKLFSFRKEVKTKLDIRKSLQELCNRSLLVKNQDNKFQFESLVAKYIKQQEPDLTNAHQQAIEYYKSNLKEVDSWQVLADVAEYLEIVDHRCELKQYALAKEILDICFDFLKLRGYYSVLVEIYEKLADKWISCLKREDKYNYAWILTNLGTVESYLGKLDFTIKFYNQSLEIFIEIGAVQGKANSLCNLGTAYSSLGEYQRAIEFHQQSLKIQQEIGDVQGKAASLMGLGNAYNSLGEYQKAIDFHQQSLAIKQEIGDVQGKAASLNNLGSAYNSLGEYQKAIDFYQQSLAINQEIGDVQGKAVSLNNLGSAYNSLGEYQKAIDFYQQSLAITQEIGDRNTEADTWFDLADTRKNLQQKSEAKEAYENSRKLYQAMGLDKKVEKCDEAIATIEEGDNNQ